MTLRREIKLQCIFNLYNRLSVWIFLFLYLGSCFWMSIFIWFNSANSNKRTRIFRQHKNNNLLNLRRLSSLRYIHCLIGALLFSSFQFFNADLDLLLQVVRFCCCCSLRFDILNRVWFDLCFQFNVHISFPICLDLLHLCLVFRRALVFVSWECSVHNSVQQPFFLL